MSIFGTLMSKIMGRSPDAPTPAPAAAPAATTPAASTPTAAAATAAPPVVDVEAVLEGLASKYSHKVNWRYSIVDLMTLLGMDSSLSQRRELAPQHGEPRDTTDTPNNNNRVHRSWRKTAARSRQTCWTDTEVNAVRPRSLGRTALGGRTRLRRGMHPRFSTVVPD